MNTTKLLKNLETLKERIVRKPDSYTPEYARTILEAFQKYTRTSTINYMLTTTELLTARQWAFPTYTTTLYPTELGVPNLYIEGSFSGLSIWLKFKAFWLSLMQFLIMPKLLRGFSFKHIKFLIPILGSPYTGNELWEAGIDKTMMNTFEKCKKNIFEFWKSNPIFKDKQIILNNIIQTYEKNLWIACICSAFPLLDYLVRMFFKTRRFEIDINYILAVFKQAAIGSKDFKPGYIAEQLAHEKGISNVSQALESDLRIVGIALGSFVDIASVFYQYYRKDESSIGRLNRHAVIHCDTHYGTRINTIKLLSFIDLTLRLEPVFDILFKEQ